MGGIFWEKFFERVFGEDFLGGIFWEDFLGRIFLGGFFWEDFLEYFFGRIFWEEFFGRNYLVEINKELKLLSRFWGNFVSMQGRKEEGGRILILRSATQAHRT